MKSNKIFTAPRIAGYAVIFLSFILSLYTKDNTYWSIAIPSGMSAIVAETVGDRFGKNNKNNIYETT